MSDVTVARLLGFVIAVVGVAGGAISWANGLTLFLPFAAVLLVLATVIQGYAWSWRQNSGPGSARHPAR